jgi:DTW domain-containing protein YfiP
MLGDLCVCALIPNPKIETRTRVVLFIHRYEDRKPTNTGRLATECLANSEVFVRGHDDAPSPPFVSDASSRPVLLFPHDDAKPLSPPAPGEPPVTLIVPDGTWRQASKVRKRVPGLRDMPCVSLPLGPRSTYYLRNEAHETGLATIEAIARAMDILEGAHVGRALLTVFRAMVERTLRSRGVPISPAANSR